MPSKTERQLLEGPDRIFRLAEPVLTQTLGQGAYQLGGGTALAAVWDHRHSTDVDLFADLSAYRARMNSNNDRQQLAEELHAALEPLEPERIDVEWGYIKAVCRGGEFGLYTPPLPLDTPMLTTDRVSGTDVALERPADILARKIHGRMLSNGELTLRDLYDIAAASVLAREDLEVALLSVDERDLETLSKELRLLPDDWVTNPKMSGRILLEVQRPAALAQTPGRCVEVVRDLFSGDWTWADEIRAQLREEAQAKGTHGGNWGEH